MKTTGLLLILLFLMTPSLRAVSQSNLSANRIDSNIARDRRENDGFRVAACQLAGQRASSPEVCDYASMKLKSIPAVTPQTDPPVVGDDANAVLLRKNLDSLKTCAKADFDHVFLTGMILVDLSDKASTTLELRSGHDEEAKAAAVKLKPLLEADLHTLVVLLRQLPR